MLDGSTLHIREFVDVQHTIIRDTYAYQYMPIHQPVVWAIHKELASCGSAGAG